jgi:hypothetical protein
MNKQTYTIGILSITALILFVANLMMPTSAHGGFVMKDRDYQLITARQQVGDEAIYVLDSRTGLMAVFNYDPGRKAIVLRQVRAVQDAFAGALPTR